jgi:hypothetical protein
MCSSLHRLVAAWSLLALMALVVVPPSVWHHHEEVADHHHAEGGATVENDCPVCDKALPIALEERVFGLSIVVEVMGSVGAAILPKAHVGHALRNADRGPPALA